MFATDGTEIAQVSYSYIYNALIGLLKLIFLLTFQDYLKKYVTRKCKLHKCTLSRVNPNPQILCNVSKILSLCFWTHIKCIVKTLPAKNLVLILTQYLETLLVIYSNVMIK